MTKLLFSELTYYLRGICFDIHNELRAGHAEADYENALGHRVGTGWRFVSAPARLSHRLLREAGREVSTGSDARKWQTAARVEGAAVDWPTAQGPDALLFAGHGRRSGHDPEFWCRRGMQFERLPNFAAGRPPVAKEETRSMPDDLHFPDLVGDVLTALHLVHFELGSGYLHQVYRRAARIELAHQGIAVRYLQELPLRFRHSIIGKTATRLLVVDQNVLLATVALQTVQARDRERLRWALNETGCQLGLIANFYPSRLGLDFIRRTGARTSC